MGMYSEQGFDFTGQFGHIGTLNAGRATNVSTGTFAILHGGQAHITTADDSPFNAIGIDLAEYGIQFAFPASITFYGARSDGSEVQQTFITDGIIDSIGGVDDFQTFVFSSEFTDLISLTTQTPQIIDPQLPRVDGFAFDNLQLVVVPEPTTVSYLMIALGAFAFRAHKRSRRTTQLLIRANHGRLDEEA